MQRPAQQDAGRDQYDAYHVGHGAGNHQADGTCRKKDTNNRVKEIPEESLGCEGEEKDTQRRGDQRQ